VTTTPTPVSSAHALWSAKARAVAPTVGVWGAAVISGRDPQTAGLVAVSIARSLAGVRRVAIADLIGDLPPLTSLIMRTDDDPHGIADSFRYGVSLNRIARPVDESGSLFILPSGTEAVAHEEIYRNERWRRLAAGFAEVNATMLIVAAPDVPGFDDLVRYVGGLVRVGEQAPDAPTDVGNVLDIPTPEPLAKAAARANDRARRTASTPSDERRSRGLALVAVIAALIVGGTMAWPMLRDRFQLRAPESALGSGSPGVASTPIPTVAVPADVRVRPDSASPQIADSAWVSGTDSALLVRNPEDSAVASRYAVFLLAANTAISAVPAVEKAARGAGMTDSMLAQLAVSPVALGADSARWYRVTMGAFSDRAAAESLLVQLRRARVVGETSGSVISAPFAFELARDVAPDSIRSAVTTWRSRGLRPYVLRTRSGAGRLYVGAFEAPTQAGVFADSLRLLGVDSPLAFRIGRSSP
jgi:hypothetical protein